MAKTTDTQVASGRRTTPPFRADHVGSLLRPRRLLEAREDLARGAITAAQLGAIEDEEITKLVQMQRDVGLQSATDGELRRGSWHMDFIYQLGGIEKVQGDIEVHFRNADGTVDFRPAAIAVNEPVRLDHTIFVEDFRFLQSVAGEGVTPKLTIPSPNMVHYRSGRCTRTSSRFGRICRPPTPSRSPPSRRWGAATSSSTTRASPTSTTPASASI
jgi:5-methyltetrahydropteroyltriglutamate--homocysteine methyltransferase